MKHTIYLKAGAASAMGAALLLCGCKAARENILATTTTVIGVQIHQKDTDKTPEMKVGYARSEFAFVPTDKVADGKGGSATNSADVLMEINAQGNLALGAAYQGGVYQRLAVGRVAVSQPGAAYMMAKDNKGVVSATTAKSVSESIKASALGVVESENRDAQTLAEATDDGAGKVDQAKLEKLVKGTLLEGHTAKFRGVPVDDLKEKLKGSWRPYIPQMNANNK